MSDEVEGLPNPNPEGHELEPEQNVPIDAESLARHYEQDDVDVRGIVRFGIIIGVASVVAGTVLAVVVRAWTAGPLPVQFQVPPALVTPPVVPGPGLDAAPEMNLESYLARENERLYGYGWVDRDAGVVHIPIDEAMRRLLDQGVPAREGEAPTFGLEPSFKLDASGGLEPAGEGSIDVSAGGSGDSASEGEDESTEVDEAASEDSDSDATGTDAEESETSETGEGSGEASEEPGGSESGGDATGNDAEDEEADAEDSPSSSDVGDDSGAAPGSISPEDEDAEGEEPGGSQSGS